MTIRSVLAGITPTAGDLTTAAGKGIDLNGMLELATMQANDLANTLNTIISEVLTPASDSSNASSLTTELDLL